MAEPWAGDFSYAYFRRLLGAIRTFGNPQIFRDAPTLLSRATPAVFLRHDVDVSLEHALRMAAVEREESVPSTYMVMNTGLLYRLQAAESRRLLREIGALGHEVGLHFDYPDALRTSEGVPAESLEQPIRRACAELEDALGAPVTSLSFHRPVPAVIRGPLMIANRVNAYAAPLMHRYISDSKGSWREGEPLARLAEAAAGGMLQVLTHPIWWGERHRNAAERLQDFFEERAAGLSPEAQSRLDDDLVTTLPGVARPRYVS